MEWTRFKIYKLRGNSNRIVDFEHLTNILKQGCYKCQKELSVTRILNETKYDLGSIFKVSCKYCLTVNKITNSTSTIGKGRTGHGSFEVNTKMALGMIDAGLGESHASSFVFNMGIPTPNQGPIGTIIIFH